MTAALEGLKALSISDDVMTADWASLFGLAIDGKGAESLEPTIPFPRSVTSKQQHSLRLAFGPFLLTEET